MKVSTREDIDAPAAFVFAVLSDTEHWERAALRRGASVVRQDSLTEPGPGMAWSVAFDFRGRPRQLSLRCTDFDSPQRIVFDGESRAVSGTLGIDLVDMGPRRTRVILGLEVRPRTIAARLFLQTLKLARSRVQARFDTRAAQLAADIEARFRSAAAR